MIGRGRGSRRQGVTQIKETLVTAAANAGLTVIATATAQPCLVKTSIIYPDEAAPAHLTSAALKANPSQVTELISAAVATQAALAAIAKQVNSVVPARLAVGDTIVIDLQGTGTDAVAFTVSIEYEAIVDGGYLA